MRLQKSPRGAASQTVLRAAAVASERDGAHGRIVSSRSDDEDNDDGSRSGELSENEFGFRKRSGEALVRESDVPHVIVRSAAIDDARVEEGRDVQTVDDPDAAAAAAMEAAEGAADAQGAVGVRDDEAKKRRIHPRDLARFLVGCLEPSARGGESGRVVEAWTSVDGK